MRRYMRSVTPTQPGANCPSGHNLIRQATSQGTRPRRFPNTRPAMRLASTPSSYRVVNVANTRLGFEPSDLRPEEHGPKAIAEYKPLLASSRDSDGSWHKGRFSRRR